MTTSNEARQKCALCLGLKEFVDSHIIPRAFYEDLRSANLERLTEDGHVCNYKQGIYGQFMCKECESKFQTIDDNAVQLLKQAHWKKNVYTTGDKQISVIENAFHKRSILNTFAASVLWRASASRRTEYSEINIGPYAEKFRAAFLKGEVSEDMLSSTGFLYREYRGGNSHISNQKFDPYHKFLPNRHFLDQFGTFSCHSFGFPYGELIIRLGGHAPSSGFMVLDDLGFNGCATLWSCNLSPQYPNLFIMVMPKNEFDDLFAVRPSLPRLSGGCKSGMKRDASPN